MKTTFLTLACPDWDLETIVKRAVQYGYDGVDFRGIRDVLDVSTLPAFSSGVARTRRLFSDAGIAVSCFSTSIFLCDPNLRAAGLDEARRTIQLARELGVINIRVFGGGEPDRVGLSRAVEIGAEMMSAILALEGARGLRWNIETHDHWVTRERCLKLLNAIDDPAVGITWDIGHTSRVGAETPAESVAAYGPQIGYVHIKDAVRTSGPDGDGWRYVLPGRGELPLGAGVRELQRINYDGWLAFEHEKRWVPDLESPEEALPAFTRWARSVIHGRDVIRDPSGRPVIIA